MYVELWLRTVVRTVSGISKVFGARVGMHQDLALYYLQLLWKRLLGSFALVGLPWELLYVDNLMVIADSEEEVVRTLWKAGLEVKG